MTPKHLYMDPMAYHVKRFTCTCTSKAIKGSVKGSKQKLDLKIGLFLVNKCSLVTPKSTKLGLNGPGGG